MYRFDQGCLCGLADDTIDNYLAAADLDQKTLDDLYRFRQEVVSKQKPFQTVEIPSLAVLALLRKEAERQLESGPYGIKSFFERLNAAGE